MMTVTITAFERSPDRGRGLARDMRVRWALEEVGQPYEVRLLSFRVLSEPAHLALQTFGHELRRGLRSLRGRRSCVTFARAGRALFSACS